MHVNIVCLLELTITKMTKTEKLEGKCSLFNYVFSYPFTIHNVQMFWENSPEFVFLE